MCRQNNRIVASASSSAARLDDRRLSLWFKYPYDLLLWSLHAGPTPGLRTGRTGRGGGSGVCNGVAISCCSGYNRNSSLCDFLLGFVECCNGIMVATGRTALPQALFRNCCNTSLCLHKTIPVCKALVAKTCRTLAKTYIHKDSLMPVTQETDRHVHWLLCVFH